LLVGLIADEEGKAVNKERAGREKEEAQRETGSEESLTRKRLSRRAVKKKEIVTRPSAIHYFSLSQDRYFCRKPLIDK
jgi:hypothetical protein